MAAVALALSIWTTFRTPEATLPVPDRVAAMETGGVAERASPSYPVGASPVAANARLAAFETVESRVTALEQNQSGASTSRSVESASDRLPVDVRSPQYVRLNSPEPSVVVQQGEDGSVFAINTDPSLAGNVIEIEALRADGSVEMMTITVPPPEY